MPLILENTESLQVRPLASWIVLIWVYPSVWILSSKNSRLMNTEMEIICVWDFWGIAYDSFWFVGEDKSNGICIQECETERERNVRLWELAGSRFTSFCLSWSCWTQTRESYSAKNRQAHLKGATDILYLDDELLICCPWQVLTKDALWQGCLWFIRALGFRQWNYQ